MAKFRYSVFMSFLIFVAIVLVPVIHGQLSPYFYQIVCPEALPTIRKVVQRAIASEPRMGASLLRLHFHDCFVNGCDGSNLLDDTPTLKGEKMAEPNLNSLRGFDVVDEIKAAVNLACHGNVVSCADILAVAARDSVYTLGGPYYEVLLGRRDSLTASREDANSDLPSLTLNFSGLLSNFRAQGLGLKDLVVLSGAHTIGLARCVSFRNRIYNDTSIDPEFAAALQRQCPDTESANNITAPLDATTTVFDTVYFWELLQQKGLLHSDQALFSGANRESDELVRFYSYNPRKYGEDFGKSMIKMGNIKTLTGAQGEIRMDCRKTNQEPRLADPTGPHSY